MLSGSPRKPEVFPETIPPPDSSPGFDGQTKPKIVSHGDNLAAMVRLVREHIGKHGCACGPHGRPSTTGKFANPAIKAFGQRIRQHLQATGRALAMGLGSLRQGTTSRIESFRTTEMRRGVFQPDQAAVMQVGKDGCDGAALASERSGTPCVGIKVLEEKLVHRIIGSVDFEQHFANVSFRCGLARQDDPPFRLRHLRTLIA